MRFVDRLVADGILHRLEGDERAVSLALPPDRIAAERALRVGLSFGASGGTGSAARVLDHLRGVQLDALAGRSLEDLLSEGRGPAAQPDEGRSQRA